MKKHTHKSTNSTTLSVSECAPETFDKAGFEALEFVTVGEAFNRKKKAKDLAATKPDKQT